MTGHDTNIFPLAPAQLRYRSLKRHLWPLAVLLLATVIVYGRIVGHGFIFNWDDEYYVVRNAAIHGFSWDNIRTVFSRCFVGNYAPVQMLSYMLDYTVWGLWPGGFYLSNLLIHAGNGILLYVLLYRWYSDRFTAFCAVAIFLLHPVQVETVAWVSQRKTLLSLFFFLSAWIAYCRYQEAGKGEGRFAYVAAVIFFILSLLSKSVAVIFPVILLAYDYCFQNGERRFRFTDKIPFILAAGIVGIISIYSQQPLDDGWMGQGGGVRTFHGGSPLATFFTMLPVFCRYLLLLVWPVDLSLLYFPPIHAFFDFKVAAAAIILCSFGWGAFKLFKIEPALGFWAGFFWLGLLPVAQIIPLTTLMNDRYLYFPIIGAAVLYASAAAFLKKKSSPSQRILCSSIVLVPVILLMAGSYMRVQVWENPVAAWGDTAAKNPQNEFILYKLAEAYHYSDPPMLYEAIDIYRRVTERDPAAKLAWYQLGVAYSTLGDYKQSTEVLETFLRLESDHVMARTALAYSLQMTGQFQRAESEYLWALRLQPEALPIVSLLGSLAIAQGDPLKARKYYLKVESAWHDPESSFQLSRIEAFAGNGNDSYVWLEKALQRGYSDRNALASAVELASMQGKERFNALVQKYSAQLHQQ